MATIQRVSVVTCPHCGFEKSEEMPMHACMFFYECQKCGSVLKPKQGDCCVFCSYGTVPCPPVQTGGTREHGGTV
ncbi:MAG: GDCCVxC domain-containing (seleno)protein [Acidiferrobacterales bacterium]